MDESNDENTSLYLDWSNTLLDVNDVYYIYWDICYSYRGGILGYLDVDYERELRLKLGKWDIVRDVSGAGGIENWEFELGTYDDEDEDEKEENGDSFVIGGTPWEDEDEDDDFLGGGIVKSILANDLKGNKGI